MSFNSKTLIPFNYFGGKYSACQWILQFLPETKSYVEVFGGSGIILINKKPSPIETYNDINGHVVNFFRMLRERPEELITAIYLTPYAREEYQYCFKNLKCDDPLEWSRRFFVAVSQSFNGTISRQTGWKISTKETRATISEAISRWLSKVPNLINIIERLKMVQISNWDFRLVFEKFNSPDCLLYLDPPYKHETRCNNNEYESEMSDSDHGDLLNLSMQSKCKIMISGYDSEQYNDMLLGGGWFTIDGAKKRTGLSHSTKTEKIWMNYNPHKINGVMKLDFEPTNNPN